MRIAIYVEQLFSTMTGERRVLENLLPQLFYFGKEDTFTLFHSRNYAIPSQFDWLPSIPNNVQIIRLPLNRKALIANWILRGVSIERWIGTQDVIDNPSTLPVHASTGKRFVTIHDLAPFDIPAEHSQSFRWASAMSFRVLRESPDVGIFTPSTFTAERFQAHFPTIGKELIVLPWGVSSQFVRLTLEECRRRLALLGIEGPYFLFVGALNPRKNIFRMIQAFRQFVGKHDGDFSLIVCGPDGFPPGTVSRWIREAGIASRVRLVGFVGNDQLIALLNGTVGLVFPSLYEGFGLPVLEAMACGAPVICSSNSSFGEIGGPAMRVDPVNIEALAKAMLELANGQSQRAALAEAGHLHAARFTWETTAISKLKAYKS